MPKEPKACIGCGHEFSFLSRGLCRNCYNKALRSVLSRYTTWDRLVSEGKAEYVAMDDKRRGKSYGITSTVRKGMVSTPTMNSIAKVVAAQLRNQGDQLCIEFQRKREINSC